MPNEKRVLLAGESWVSAATHYKGFDQFGSRHLPPRRRAAGRRRWPAASSSCATCRRTRRRPTFPLTARRPRRLRRRHPLRPRLEHAAAPPRRLAPAASRSRTGSSCLRDYVARRRRPHDDRRLLLASRASTAARAATDAGRGGAAGRRACRTTTGSRCRRASAPSWCGPDHPILEGLPAHWPLLLGLNEVRLKAAPTPSCWPARRTPRAATRSSSPARYGQGRTLAWTSDIGPHWLPQAFVDWEGYARLWRQALAWVCGQS